MGWSPRTLGPTRAGASKWRFGPRFAAAAVVLADRFRSAYLVRVASPIGVIDFLTTHLASGGDDRACNPGLCPPPCDSTGSLRTCQARQVPAFAEEVALDGGVTVVGGDLNDSAGSPALAVFDEAGNVDSHLAAGHGECEPASGTGCTAGREDTSLAALLRGATAAGHSVAFGWPKLTWVSHTVFFLSSMQYQIRPDRVTSYCHWSISVPLRGTVR